MRTARSLIASNNGRTVVIEERENGAPIRQWHLTADTAAEFAGDLVAACRRAIAAPAPAAAE